MQQFSVQVRAALPIPIWWVHKDETPSGVIGSILQVLRKRVALNGDSCMPKQESIYARK